MNSDLWRWSASDLAQAIREKKVSSTEVVLAHFARMEQVHVNAVTIVLRQEALRAASEADRMVAAGEPLGRLHGVPFTVKENIDVAGSATTQGVIAFQGAIPPVDAPHIAQLKRAGAIPIARTNTPDMGLRWHTDNALRGATINPWDASRTPGGSSGGEAAALATGMTPLGVGNDYGGSLRWPSQACGTTAIRPTLGRIPHATSLPAPERTITGQLFAVQGPMARHVRDLRLALEIMSRPDPRDPWYTPAALAPPSQAIKVAVTIDPAGQGVDPAVAAGVKKAAEALTDAGYIVEEVEPPLIAESANLWGQLLLTEVQSVILPAIEPIISPGALQFLQHALEVQPLPDLVGYIQGLAERNRIAREWSLFLARYPLLLGPVSTSPPFKVGYDLLGSQQVSDIMRALRLVTAINLLGLPAVAMPVGIINGLPQAVQIIGARYREDLCLDAAEAIEQRVGTLTPIDPK